MKQLLTAAQAFLSLPVAVGVLSLALTSVLAQDTPDAPKSGTVTVAVGDVKVTPPGADAAQALNVDDTVLVGSTITTGANSRAVIVLSQQAAIRVSENSELVVTEVKESDTEPKVLVDLKTGSLGALVKPKVTAAMDFQIKTPSGIAAARGTFFSVVVENGKGYAQVKEGKVELIPNQPADANQ